MMNPISWAKKEFARIRLQRRLLLPQRRSIDANCRPVSPVQEVIISADLRCGECERRVLSILSSIEDVESIVVHVLEKKVTLTPATARK